MTYPIQVVVRETGINAHVLRVWEKRYQAVVPKRTATQRRTYSEADIRKLKLLREATALGHPIGSVAKLAAERLEKLVKPKAAPAPPAKRAPNGSAKGDPLIALCIQAVKAFDTDALNRLLDRAALEAGHNALLRRTIAPLAQRIGELWSEGALKVAHEHFSTAILRGYLLNPARRYAGVSGAATLVAATPQGQLHEMGAVMAASLAAEQGWRTVYLGPSLPADEIAGVALDVDARAVALSVVYPENDPNLERELRNLRRFLPKGVAILVGGRAAGRFRAAIEATRAVLVKDLAQLQTELAKIRRKRA